MHNINPDYIVGLIDGEGSFTVYIRHPKKFFKNRRVRAEPKFYIKLVEKDKDILYKLKQFFGCGSVYFQKDRRRNHQHCYRYEVYNRNDLKKVIIPFFKKHRPKLTSKQKDFNIFCKLMDMIVKNSHLSNQGLKQLYNLKQQMH